MYVVVYWWRVKPGKEEQFRDAWRRGTREIARIYGGLGSRLHLTVRLRRRCRRPIALLA